MPVAPVTAVSDPNDSLLAEMNGAKEVQGLGGVTLHSTAGDHALEPAPSLNEQLEVGRITHPRAPVPSAQPRAAATDKTHSKAAGGNGYRVTLEGEYVAKNPTGSGKIHKHYHLDFNLPELTNKRGESALGIIVGASKETSLLKSALARLDPPGIGVRTHKIVAVEPLSSATAPPTNIQYMNLDALKNLVREFELPLDVEAYWDVNHLRDDIIELRTNTGADEIDPKTRAVVHKGSATLALERIQSRAAERKEQHELELMNPENAPLPPAEMVGFE